MKCNNVWAKMKKLFFVLLCIVNIFTWWITVPIVILGLVIYRSFYIPLIKKSEELDGHQIRKNINITYLFLAFFETLVFIATIYALYPTISYELIRDPSMVLINAPLIVLVGIIFGCFPIAVYVATWNCVFYEGSLL